jgi:alcohol dehydrogenase, propanol-preferring
MKAMVVERPGALPIRVVRRLPEPGPGQIRLRVSACGVCRTDLHVVDGELPQCRYPIVPGHEIVGRVDRLGCGVTGFAEDERIGVPWLGSTCGRCRFCREGFENLCDEARFTGCQIDGGYQEYAIADERFCFRLPEKYSDVEAAPLLCAGLIGHRAHRMAGDAEKLGIYGFGAAAHIMGQIARHQGQSVYAFTRPGDATAQEFARSLGAVWAGGSDQETPELLDAAVIFAPVGSLVPAALKAVRKGGSVISAGIHMSDIPAFPYEILWGERMVRSVANLTRRDGEDFMRLAAEAPSEIVTTTYPLDEAGRALTDLRDGRMNGAAVLIP